jgi:hypothetical protein
MILSKKKVVAYSGSIFNKVTGGKDGDKLTTMAFILTVISGFVLMLSAFMGGAVTKLAGRKTLLMLGEVVCIATLVLLGIMSAIYESSGNHDYLSVPIILCIFAYELSFGTTLGPIVWVYNAEILPVNFLSFIK